MLMGLLMAKGTDMNTSSTKAPARRMSLRRQLALMAQSDAEERATRPDGVVTPGVGWDYERVRAIRVRLGLAPVEQPATDDVAHMIDC
jgi:hypothetical protein